MLGYRQQATSSKITGATTVALSTLLPSSAGRYPSPGNVAFTFLNVGTADAYVVIGSEVISGTSIPAQVGGVPGKAEIADLDWDDVVAHLKLYCPSGAEVYVTPYVSGAR